MLCWRRVWLSPAAPRGKPAIPGESGPPQGGPARAGSRAGEGQGGASEGGLPLARVVDAGGRPQEQDEAAAGPGGQAPRKLAADRQAVAGDHRHRYAAPAQPDAPSAALARHVQAGPNGVRADAPLGGGLLRGGRRLKYLSALAAQDQRLIKTYDTSLTDLSEKRAEFARYKKEVAEATGKAAYAQSDRGGATEVPRPPGQVREDKAGHLAAVKELEKSAKDLQALIARLQSDEERQRRASRAAPKREGARGQPGKEEALDLPDDGRFERLRGRLPWPAAGRWRPPSGGKSTLGSAR